MEKIARYFLTEADVDAFELRLREQYRKVTRTKYIQLETIFAEWVVQDKVTQ